MRVAGTNLRGVDPEQVTVAEAMSTGVYHVAPDTPIDEVATELARHRYGSALVVERNQLVGIFTMVDACRALGEVFSSRLAR
jgi:acetoin utilization protein AcuB